MIEYKEPDLTREYFVVWLCVPGMEGTTFNFKTWEEAKDFYSDATREGVWCEHVDACGRSDLLLIQPEGINGGKIRIEA